MTPDELTAMTTSPDSKLELNEVSVQVKVASASLTTINPIRRGDLGSAGDRIEHVLVTAG